VTKIGAGVDARDDQVDRFFEEAQRGERDAIGWGAVAGEGLCAVSESDFLDAQCAVEGFDVPASGPISVGRENCDFSQLSHFLHKREQAGGVYAIVICDQNMFCHLFALVEVLVAFLKRIHGEDDQKTDHHDGKNCCFHFLIP